MGSATILAGQTYVDVPHNQPTPPTIDQIVITPQDDLGGRTYWPSNITSTTFRINISSMNCDCNHVFSHQIVSQAAVLPPQPLVISWP